MGTYLDRGWRVAQKNRLCMRLCRILDHSRDLHSTTNSTWIGSTATNLCKHAVRSASTTPTTYLVTENVMANTTENKEISQVLPLIEVQ